MKIIVFVLKRIIFAFCIIYAFNMVVVGLELFIPMNVTTLSVVSILGIPGLLALVGVYYCLT